MSEGFSFFFYCNPVPQPIPRLCFSLLLPFSLSFLLSGINTDTLILSLSGLNFEVEKTNDHQMKINLTYGSDLKFKNQRLSHMSSVMKSFTKSHGPSLLCELFSSKNNYDNNNENNTVDVIPLVPILRQRALRSLYGNTQTHTRRRFGGHKWS